jgi:hypothetical protein
MPKEANKVLARRIVNQGQSERAVRLFAWADATRDEIGDQRPRVEQNSVERDLAVIHSELSDTEFKNFSRQGYTMTMEQEIALPSEK